MSRMMDKPAESPDEDTVSQKSSGMSPANVKNTLVRAHSSFMKTMQQVKESYAQLPMGQGSKVTPKASSPGTSEPPSPSLSSGLSSGLISPLRSIGRLLQFKEEDDPQDTPRTSRSLPRSMTDPGLGSSLRRVTSGRRSLRFRSKKDESKGLKEEPQPEGKEEQEEQEEEEEEEEKREEIEEEYTLPELPHTPLSVMQINKLIEMEVLEEAHLNLLAMRQEFQRDREESGEDSPMELAKKEKDLSLLYGQLRDKINSLVRDSNSLPSRNKELLVHVARIIQEEERRAEEPGGLPHSWMEAWREAVEGGVRAKVESIHLEKQEANGSWLALHLGLLGKTIVEDLESVKKELRWSYPASFQVFSTYVRSYHQVVGQHLKKLEQQAKELKDLHHLLVWILNSYKSERIMGSPTLQPEMRDESAELQLDDNFLPQLRNKYSSRVKVDLRFSLDRIAVLENEDVWEKQTPPSKDEKILCSKIQMDINTRVKGIVQAGKIDAQLGVMVTASCLEELKQFPKRFEAAFMHHCSAPKLLVTDYQITYINSFMALQQNMEEYKDECPEQVEGFKKEVKWLIVRLSQAIEDHFTEDIKPFLRRMMTRKWLTNDADYKQLHRRTELLAKHCSLMTPSHAQEFASRLHLHVVKEYVGQLMKKNYSCKNRKHEKAAAKICQQWEELEDLFEEMKSTHKWLYAIGYELSNIIGQKNATDIKNNLQPIVENYPDFSKKHLVAVLHFRGLLRGREHQRILQRFTELKRKLNPAPVRGDHSRDLFASMPVTMNTDCLSNLPFSCLSFFMPDN